MRQSRAVAGESQRRRSPVAVSRPQSQPWSSDVSVDVMLRAPVIDTGAAAVVSTYRNYWCVYAGRMTSDDDSYAGGHLF